ncbi:unnamed protein product [Protopolystoma xenopodis]|uniref:Uncharacterized protein n=1 Tax=Protopolystoma xenopodis TaxID=117903 RepID=A0A3S5CS81_9PLAT|nr:unnamed protein product [Protopolystoma xenopodis]
MLQPKCTLLPSIRTSGACNSFALKHCIQISAVRIVSNSFPLFAQNVHMPMQVYFWSDALCKLSLTEFPAITEPAWLGPISPSVETIRPSPSSPVLVSLRP